ncbi:MAG: hypothetical protein H6741_26420 [Alphaproteobacteria bacterium]|nr:hypothetical protein [Alphaproteobacteria bacterium]MCB9796244.1 hypothetical protein [Alphaproteobacteria bacterium]
MRQSPTRPSPLAGVLLLTALLSLACLGRDKRADDSGPTSSDDSAPTTTDDSGPVGDDTQAEGTPALRLDPVSHDFGSNYIGCEHQDVEVRLLNEGDGPATVTALRWSCAQDLYLDTPSGGPPWRIAAGQELPLTVRWAHWYEGDARCTLSVEWDGETLQGSYEGRGNVYREAADLFFADNSGRLSGDFSVTFGGDLTLRDEDDARLDYWDLDCAVDFDEDSLSCSGLAPGPYLAEYAMRPCRTYGEF